MIQFIILLLIVLIIFKISQDRPHIGCGIYFVLSSCFVAYTVYVINCDIGVENVRPGKNIYNPLLPNTLNYKNYSYRLNPKYIYTDSLDDVDCEKCQDA